MLAESYIFYSDVYFVQNFSMKLGILTITIKLMKIPMTKPVMKVIGIASVATLMEITGLFLIHNYGIVLIITHLVEVPVIMLILFWKQKENLWKAIGIGYVALILTNGLVELFWNLIGEGWLYPLLVLFGNVASILLVLWAIKKWQVSKGIYAVDIYMPDIIWTAKGFYDSGNHLKDPYTGKSVHIISRTLARRLEFLEEKKVCIPYQSLGNEEGLIDVYYVSEIKIKKQDTMIAQKEVPLAVAEDGLFTGKGYEMIMNEDLW